MKFDFMLSLGEFYFVLPFCRLIFTVVVRILNLHPEIKVNDLLVHISLPYHLGNEFLILNRVLISGVKNELQTFVSTYLV